MPLAKDRQHSIGRSNPLLLFVFEAGYLAPQLHCVVLDGIELPILLPLWAGCWDYKPATGLCDAGTDQGTVPGHTLYQGASSSRGTLF